MKQLLHGPWSPEDFGEHWALGPPDLAPLAGLPASGKLGLAAQLAHWRAHGRFPGDETDFSPAAVGHLAAQLGVGAGALEAYDWAGRTGRRHRRLVLDHRAVTDFGDAAERGFRRWLAEDLLPREPSPSMLEAEIGAWFARERIGRPGAWRLDRILRSARTVHDDTALQRVADRLDAGARESLRQWRGHPELCVAPDDPMPGDGEVAVIERHDARCLIIPRGEVDGPGRKTGSVVACRDDLDVVAGPAGRPLERPSRSWGWYVPGRGIWAGGAMRWRITLELAGADGTRQVLEIGAGERPPSGHTAATLGLGSGGGQSDLGRPPAASRDGAGRRALP